MLDPNFRPISLQLLCSGIAAPLQRGCRRIPKITKNAYVIECEYFPMFPILLKAVCYGDWHAKPQEKIETTRTAKSAGARSPTKHAATERNDHRNRSPHHLFGFVAKNAWKVTECRPFQRLNHSTGAFRPATKPATPPQNAPTGPKTSPKAAPAAAP